ncbi:class I SAM-dependent methyltransferase [Prochlorococcus sp. AH-716-D22]|nr:class I SAM-dependent methyltransferase [Prochlorococcus sp. AH-716-D22]
MSKNIEELSDNLDVNTVKSFGEEWSRYDQTELKYEEAEKYFNDYFAVFPWEIIDNDSVGFDMGCGTGRWARLFADKVKLLNCIEPSKAINVAKKNLSDKKNLCFIRGDVNNSGLELNSQDFGYCLGVLHHIPDTQEAINTCVKLLKRGAPFLVYIYYFFDDKPGWYKKIWIFSNIFRKFISKMPRRLKQISTDLIALIIYLPMARFSKILEKLSIPVNKIPLSYYRHSSFYTMRTDSLDRFGTPLEQRFKKSKIQDMMHKAGLKNINFSNSAPYWCCVGYKK